MVLFSLSRERERETVEVSGKEELKFGGRGYFCHLQKKIFGG